jgi:hypothetical protein
MPDLSGRALGERGRFMLVFVVLVMQFTSRLLQGVADLFFLAVTGAIRLSFALAAYAVNAVRIVRRQHGTATWDR